MTSAITPTKIKQNNKKLIYQYIYEHAKVSQQDICADLRLSRPTVTQNLAALEADGLIEKAGLIDTDAVGRKAAAYSIAARYKVAIGVEITRKEVKMMALDLNGARIDRTVSAINYENTSLYYQSVCIDILSFIRKLGLTAEQVLGIRLSMQGLVSPDGRYMVYGKILNCTGLCIEEFEKYLPYNCRFIHDADSAAFAEIWSDPDLTEAFFVSLSKHIGGSIIRDRQIVVGKHGHSGTFEHIRFHPLDNAAPPKICYCGKKGCIDTVCSLHDLLEEGEDLEQFIAKKDAGDPSVLQRWADFLKNLGEVLNMLHLVYDTDFILGGYLAPYLTQEDLDTLYARIRELNAFPEEDDFLRISKMPKHSITIGGALVMIQEFLQSEIF